MGDGFAAQGLYETLGRENMKCPRCGEHEGMWVHHGHEDGDDEACEQNGLCHTYCRNCDNGVCELC